MDGGGSSGGWSGTAPCLLALQGLLAQPKKSFTPHLYMSSKKPLWKLRGMLLKPHGGGVLRATVTQNICVHVMCLAAVSLLWYAEFHDDLTRGRPADLPKPLGFQGS